MQQHTDDRLYGIRGEMPWMGTYGSEGELSKRETVLRVKCQAPTLSAASSAVAPRSH